MVPHIKVTVEYGGDTVSQQCAHFIDAIKFLADCEYLIRRNSKLKDPVDLMTTVIQKENMNKLLGRTQDVNKV